MTYLVARVRDLRQKRSVQPRRRYPVMQIVPVPWFSNVTSVVANRHESQRVKNVILHCRSKIVLGPRNISKVNFLARTFPPASRETAYRR
jgi:hypothetical protein